MHVEPAMIFVTFFPILQAFQYSCSASEAIYMNKKTIVAAGLVFVLAAFQAVAASHHVRGHITAQGQLCGVSSPYKCGSIEAQQLVDERQPESVHRKERCD
jgi:hypothetical protein